MLVLDMQKLEIACAKKGYNKTLLAKNAGISYSNILKVTKGYTNLTAVNLSKIAKALDVNPQELIKTDTATD